MAAIIRRYVLLGLGILACLYAVGVLYYVYVLPDLGFKSAFSTVVEGVPYDVQPFTANGPLPAPGDKIHKVGGIEIKSWPDLLNAPRNCRTHFDTMAASGLAKTDELGDRYVLVVFEKSKALIPLEQSKDAGPPYIFRAWCRLDHLPFTELLPSISWFVLKILLFVVGVLVLWKRPNDPASVQFYLLCVVSLGAYMGGYHWAHITTNMFLIVGFIICAMLLPPVTLHFFLLFPRPKPFMLTHRLLSLGVIYGIPVFFLATLLFLYFNLRAAYELDPSLPEVNSWGEGLKWACYFALSISALWYLLSVTSLIVSLFTVSDAMERNQVKCILTGAIVALVPIGYSLSLAMIFQDAFAAGHATWPMFAASICFTLAFVISITRYRLMELDQIISSGAGYFFISFVAGLVYYGVVFLGALLFNLQFTSPHWTEALRVSTFALVLLLVLNLARNRLITTLDRRFNREKYHLDRTLQRMGEAVQQLVDPPTLVQRLLHATADLLGVGHGAAYLRQKDSKKYQLANWVGRPPSKSEIDESGPLPALLLQRGTVTRRPNAGTRTLVAEAQLTELGGEVAFGLVHEGQLLAFLVLGPKKSGIYRPEDLNLLSAFAQITVLALGSAAGHQTIEQLNQELQAKIEKIAEQQRRILSLQMQLRQQGLLRRPARTAISAAGSAANAAAHQPVADNSDEKNDQPAPVVANIVGSSPPVRRLLQMINKVAKTDAVVLIRGESGTGKELLAQAVHELSHRADKPFIKVHCAALTPTLLESELFGHVKGAYTGAHRDKVGRFEMANGGTLFLDEVGDIALDVQTKLLRVLQERVFERVGSSEPVKVDVRIIAATHQNLEELIQQGRFREDLYYRLNVFPVYVPPLRERIDDLPELALHFLREAARRCNKNVSHIDDDAMAILKMFAWPGNIRQLENVIERAVVLVEGNTITQADLPAEVQTALPVHDDWNSQFDVDQPTDIYTNGEKLSPLNRRQWDRAEREELVNALSAAGGNKALAARRLGLARSTFLGKLKKHGLG